MPSIITNTRSFRAEHPWGAQDIAEIEGATVRLHWSDKPYRWHINDGPEVFLVLDGDVQMRFREHGEEHEVLLHAGDMFVARVGDEHVAHPLGEARILVIEKKGSV